jgi:hypothetical protein
LLAKNPNIYVKYSDETNAIHTGEGTVVPVHAIKAYRGSNDTVPLILNLGSSWW